MSFTCILGCKLKASVTLLRGRHDNAYSLKQNCRATASGPESFQKAQCWVLEELATVAYERKKKSQVAAWPSKSDPTSCPRKRDPEPWEP